MCIFRLSVLKGDFLPFYGLTWVTENSMVTVVGIQLLNPLYLNGFYRTENSNM